MLFTDIQERHRFSYFQTEKYKTEFTDPFSKKKRQKRSKRVANFIYMVPHSCKKKKNSILFLVTSMASNMRKKKTPLWPLLPKATQRARQQQRTLQGYVFFFFLSVWKKGSTLRGLLRLIFKSWSLWRSYSHGGQHSAVSAMNLQRFEGKSTGPGQTLSCPKDLLAFCKQLNQTEAMVFSCLQRNTLFLPLLCCY